jgi:hypothetical protein
MLMGPPIAAARALDVPGGSLNIARKLVKTRQRDLIEDFMSGFRLELRRILSKAVEGVRLEADPDVL